ncbi:LysR family transcriptional regulator [Enterobacter cloacae]|uniref:LysR family transcriptional regulator n=1 Tax=Enterobacter cloacae TaxID=550 RepID=A0A377M6F4_ENTCL|nr:LysR family transcriptional regulator [Enterobacter cloacae]
MLDLVESGFDVALRTGKPQDSSLIGRMIGHCPRYMLASPEYLARREPLHHPRQLVDHRCITTRPGLNGSCKARVRITAICRQCAYDG